MGLLEQLTSHREEFTVRERLIANFLESGFPHAGLDTATAVAERLNISAATVVRFVSKLGYGRYSDLQREMRGQVRSRLVSPLQRFELSDATETVHGRADVKNLMSKTFDVGLAILGRTYDAIDQHTVEGISAALIGCKGSIWVVGEKKGRSIALYIQANLGLSLRNVHLLSTEASFEADRLLDLGPEDVMLIIDVRRYVNSTVQAANWGEARGARLIVLADAVDSALYVRTSLRLAAATTGAGAFDSYLGLMLICEIICNLVTAAIPDEVRKRLALGEDAWRQFGIFSSEIR